MISSGEAPNKNAGNSNAEEYFPKMKEKRARAIQIHENEPLCKGCGLRPPTQRVAGACGGRPPL